MTMDAEKLSTALTELLVDNRVAVVTLQTLNCATACSTILYQVLSSNEIEKSKFQSVENFTKNIYIYQRVTNLFKSYH